MGAIATIVIVVQYFEFPSSRVLVSLFSVVNNRNFLSRNSLIDSKALSDMTLSNGLNTTNAGILQETTNKGEASDNKQETTEVSQSKEKEGSPNSNNESERKRGSSDSFGLVSNETKSDDLANQDKIRIQKYYKIQKRGYSLARKEGARDDGEGERDDGGR
ncbi:unnamed protein product [Dovyalis caffra]|uniref:Uncharacterized protein n=1 Tax=Dovyalis caffra TaxID=77055 RepID=A0AAV1RLB1_9ROSI|nr:unnamed protein product [Dovyalis caffra]